MYSIIKFGTKGLKNIKTIRIKLINQIEGGYNICQNILLEKISYYFLWVHLYYLEYYLF